MRKVWALIVVLTVVGWAFVSPAFDLNFFGESKRGLVILDNGSGMPIHYILYNTSPFQSLSPETEGFKETLCHWNWNPREYHDKLYFGHTSPLVIKKVEDMVRTCKEKVY